MTQEDKNILLKDLYARLPYGVEAQVQGWDEAKEEEVNIPLKIYSINTDGYVYFESNNYNVTYCSIDACHLYLRPMSSMTEKERKTLNNILEFQYYSDDSCMCEASDWLNEHHFDYRGLIPMGIALEAPRGMYESKNN